MPARRADARRIVELLGFPAAVAARAELGKQPIGFEIASD